MAHASAALAHSRRKRRAIDELEQMYGRYSAKRSHPASAVEPDGPVNDGDTEQPAPAPGLVSGFGRMYQL